MLSQLNTTEETPYKDSNKSIIIINNTNKNGFLNLDRCPNLLIFSISLLMGVTWTPEVFSAIDEKEIYYAIPTDTINILTGVYIFIIFVCKGKVLRSLEKRMKLIWREFKREATNDTSSS